MHERAYLFCISISTKEMITFCGHLAATVVLIDQQSNIDFLGSLLASP